MISAKLRPSGPMIVNNNNAATTTVNNGAKNSLTISGIFLLKKISNLAVMNPIIKAMIIPP